MDIRKYAISTLASLSDEQMIEFVTLFGDYNTVALMESELLAEDPDAKHYSDFNEMLKEIEEEIREDDICPLKRRRNK